MPTEWPAKWRDQDPLMLGAFADFLLYVVTETNYADEWQKRTGKKLPHAPRTTLDRMIDEACGLGPTQSPVIEEFVQSAYEELWFGNPRQDDVEKEISQ